VHKLLIDFKKAYDSIRREGGVLYNILIEFGISMELVKAIPLQAWSGPEDSRELRFPDFRTTAQNGGKVPWNW